MIDATSMRDCVNACKPGYGKGGLSAESCMENEAITAKTNV